MIEFSQQSITEIWDEILPLLREHYLEIAKYKDIPLDPDIERYIALEEAGSLRVYVARDQGILVGYAAYFVNYNAHYRSSLQAVQDVLFLTKEARRGLVGYKLIKYADKQLATDGVQIVYHHVKLKMDFGPILGRLGYEPIETIWGRRL